MSKPSVDMLRRFYQNLRDRPLDPDDPYYAPYLEKDQVRDPIAQLRVRIGWSEAASVNLLSGQRGSGKSAGLRRLKQYLEQAGAVVFLCDMRDYLEVLRDLSISLNKVGDIARAQGRLEAAARAYEESLAIMQEQRARLGDTPEVLRDLSISLDRVGDIARAQGRGENRDAYPCQQGWKDFSHRL